jgi:alpha-glucosidase
VWIGGGPNNPFGHQVHLFDRDVPESIPVMERLRQAVAAYSPERVLIGELADVDSSRISEKYTIEGQRFHAVYDFDLINAAGDTPALIEKLRQRCEFVRTGWLMNVFTNHDSVRAVSNLAGFAVEGGCANEAARMLLFLQLTLLGGAILYQGEELGLTHPELSFDQLQDPWGKNLWPDFQGRDGGRTPMPWCADAPDGGFTDGGRPWLPVVDEHRQCAVDRQQRDPSSCLSFVKALLGWRREESLLRCGAERVHAGQLAPLIMYDRHDAQRCITLVVNFSLEERWLPLAADMTPLDVIGCSIERSVRGLRLPGLGYAAIERQLDQ